MSLKKGLLWGGWQADGKGPSVMDAMTGGAHEVPRKVTPELVEGERYPNYEAIDSVGLRYALDEEKIWFYLCGQK